MRNSIQVDDGGFAAELDRLLGTATDMEPVFDAIGMRLVEQISGRFESETSPYGFAWAPWAPSTETYYPDDGNRHILDRYGDMLQSLSHVADASGLEVGFGQPYAIFHEFGTKRMPRRGMLFDDPNSGALGADDEREVLDIIAGFIAGEPI